MTDFREWASNIERAYVEHPRTYQDAYREYLRRRVAGADQSAAFYAGWMAACDALANRLVGWLDEPAGDDVNAFLGFVEELRQGDLS